MTLKLNIEHDDLETADVWEYEETVKFFSGHHDYNSQNTEHKLNDFESHEELQEHLGPEYEIHEVYSHIHGGISLSVDKLAFSCPWDSGVFGLIAFKKGEFGDYNCSLTGFVENWGRAWNGEVYYYSITDEDGEIVESCGGFIGYEHCEEEGKSQLKFCQNERKLARLSKIKDLIKNRVPLHKRLDLIPNIA